MMSPRTRDPPHAQARRAGRFARLAAVVALGVVLAAVPGDAFAYQSNKTMVCFGNVCYEVYLGVLTCLVNLCFQLTYDEQHGMSIAICDGKGGTRIGVDTSDGIIVYYPRTDGYYYIGSSSDCP